MQFRLGSQCNVNSCFVYIELLDSELDRALQLIFTNVKTKKKA